MMITSKHPVRDAVAGITTYWTSIGSALHAVRAACAEHGVEFEIDNSADYSSESGRATFKTYPARDACVICDECAKKLEDAYYGNVVVFSWFVMPSGRIEITTYVS